MLIRLLLLLSLSFFVVGSVFFFKDSYSSFDNLIFPFSFEIAGGSATSPVAVLDESAVTSSLQVVLASFSILSSFSSASLAATLAISASFLNDSAIVVVFRVFFNACSELLLAGIIIVFRLIWVVLQFLLKISVALFFPHNKSFTYTWLLSEFSRATTSCMAFLAVSSSEAAVFQAFKSADLAFFSFSLKTSISLFVSSSFSSRCCVRSGWNSSFIACIFASASSLAFWRDLRDSCLAAMAFSCSSSWDWRDVSLAKASRKVATSLESSMTLSRLTTAEFCAREAFWMAVVLASMAASKSSRSCAICCFTELSSAAEGMLL
nr:hypothetical protein Iba_chr14dCG5740 [Ipomoea batatas]